jgi:hypothetical protein
VLRTATAKSVLQKTILGILERAARIVVPWSGESSFAALVDFGHIGELDF